MSEEEENERAISQIKNYEEDRILLAKKLPVLAKAVTLLVEYRDWLNDNNAPHLAEKLDCQKLLIENFRELAEETSKSLGALSQQIRLLRNHLEQGNPIGGHRARIHEAQSNLLHELEQCAIDLTMSLQATVPASHYLGRRATEILAELDNLG